jgi:hypothetical protein
MWDPREDSYIQELAARIETLDQLHQAVVDFSQQFSLDPLIDRIEALEAAQRGPMADLSPAAAAVWQEFNDVAERVGVFEDYGDALAAFTRALADQVVPESALPQRDSFSDRSVWQWAVDCHHHDAATRSKILAIADELEGQQ